MKCSSSSHSFALHSGTCRALFLDRDGVINADHGYVYRAADFEFLDGVFEVARAACANQYKIVVITNQAGIARGFYSEQQFHEITAWMCGQFLSQGVPIAKVYFSPFHPTEGLGKYKKDDVSRKPHPGMIFQAQHELNLNLKNSILIGDKDTDIQAGLAAGVGCNILFAQADSEELSGTDYNRISALADVLPLLTGTHAKTAAQ